LTFPTKQIAPIHKQHTVGTFGLVVSRR